MENNQINEKILLTTFIFSDETTIGRQKGDEFLEPISQEHITKYADLDASLQHIKTFYMFMEDYCYNVVIPAKKGHKLLLSKLEDNNQMLAVYSLNYQEVMAVQNKQVKTKRR